MVFDSAEFDPERGVMDSENVDYVLAGHLIGTMWVHPDQGLVEVKEIRQGVERDQGRRMTFPELVLGNKRMAVSGFKRRINPSDIGDIEPVQNDLVARQIADELATLKPPQEA